MNTEITSETILKPDCYVVRYSGHRNSYTPARFVRETKTTTVVALLTGTGELTFNGTRADRSQMNLRGKSSYETCYVCFDTAACEQAIAHAAAQRAADIAASNLTTAIETAFHGVKTGYGNHHFTLEQLAAVKQATALIEAAFAPAPQPAA